MKKIMSLIIAAMAWSSAARADHPAIHGMLLFGQQKAYASHLPMFHAPHDYQALFELSFKDLAKSETLALYNEAKLSPGIFTLVPELMDLTQVLNGTKTDFTAEIFKGHFEQGGQTLGAVYVHVEKIVFSTKLNPTAPVIENNYYVFGTAGEYFAVHLIQGKPNFDSVASVNQPYKLGHPICTARFCPGPDMTLIPDAQLPLTMSSSLAPTAIAKAGDALGSMTGALADIQNVIYSETGELAN